MRAKVLFVAFLCTFAIAAIPSKVKHRKGRAKRGPVVVQKLAAPRMMRAVLNDEAPPPVFDVSTDWSLNLNQPDQTLYDQMSAVLTGVTAVPNDRTNFYSAVGGITSWSGMVESVTNNNGTYTVTVSVFPVFDTFGQSVATDYSELYSIDQNNAVTYLGFQDPNNWAGQALAVVID